MITMVYQKNHEKGQGLVEVGFLIVLVALVIIGATQLLGPIIKNYFFKIADPMNENYNEHTSIPTQELIPIQTLIPTQTLSWATCAVENGFCSFSGEALVRYGANGTWASGTYTDGVLCANSVFGDPLYGTLKSCQIYR